MFRQYALSVILLAIALVLSLGIWFSTARILMFTPRLYGTVVPDFPGRCVPAKMAGPWQEGIITVDWHHREVCYQQGNASWCKPLCQ